MSPSRCFVACFVACLLIIILLASAYKALAQMPCSPVEKVEAALVKNGLKVAADLKVRTETGEIAARVYVHPRSNSWYLIAYPVSGMACWWLTGEYFEIARLPQQPTAFHP